MPNDPPRAKASTGKKLLLSLGVTVVTLGVLEIGARVWLSATDSPFDSEKTENAMRNVLSSVEDTVPTWGRREGIDPHKTGDRMQREILHPYMGYDALGMVLAIEGEVAYFESAKSVPTFDILVLGGSVAAGFVPPGFERLVEVLHADQRFQGRPIPAMREGRGAYKQPQQVAVLQYLLSMGCIPDAVIALDGFNEVAVANQNASVGVNPVYPCADKWLALSGGGVDRESLDGMIELRGVQRRLSSLARIQLALGGYNSAVAGSLGLRMLYGLRRDANELQGAVARRMTSSDSPASVGPKFDKDVRTLTSNGARVWMEGARSLHAICEERGIFFMEVLQPTLHDAGAKPMTEDERVKGKAIQSWMDAVQYGYPKLRLAGKRLAQMGVPFLDASAVFANSSQTLYYDACHFNDEGNRILGEAIAKFFLEHIPAEATGQPAR